MQLFKLNSSKGRVLTLSLAHLINDWYMNFLQTLLPFLVVSGLEVSKGAFLISAFTITSSLLQPVAGYLVDQKNQRWLVYLGTLWMAALLSLVGLINSYPLLLVLVTLAGLGTAAFHPQASSMVSAASGDRKGFFQALFMAGGNVGWALTPLIAVPVVQYFGLEITPVFFLPGLVVALLLWFNAPRAQSPRRTASPLWPALRAVGPELLKIVSVVAFRSLTYFGMVAFLPLYLQYEGVSLLAGSRLLFLMLFCGAIGGLAGGYVSDWLGRKIVIVGTLLLATPLFYLFFISSGTMSWVMLALGGAFLMSSFSVTTVTAQELFSKNAAMASGLMLGFSVGVGGLGVGMIGILAERQGIVFAVQLLTWLPLIAGLIGLTIKGKPSYIQTIT